MKPGQDRNDAEDGHEEGDMSVEKEIDERIAG